MVETWDKLYPGLRQDLERSEIWPGVLAYIIDTHVDMEALGCGSRGNRAFSPGPESCASPTPPNNATILDEESVELMGNRDRAVEVEVRQLEPAMQETSASPA